MPELPRQSTATAITGRNTGAKELARRAAAAISHVDGASILGPPVREAPGQYAFLVGLPRGCTGRVVVIVNG